LSGERAPSGAEDARLVRLARGGDPQAFDRLVRRHLAAAHGLALRTAGDPDEAEDICQDAFITALERLETCRNPDRFRAWLMTIVKRKALDAVARRERKPESLAGVDPRPDDARRANPADRLERRTLRDALRRAMEKLPDRQRRVLLLHDYEGWTHPEIGDLLGIAPGTSRHHLHRARSAMRRALSRDAEGGGDDGPTR